MHTPTLTPIVFDAGWDWKLMEVNGWEPATTPSHHAPVTIQRLNGSWIVSNEASCALRRPEKAGEPIAFVYGLREGERCPTPEAALSLVAEYLNQPINPYAWVRENAD